MNLRRRIDLQKGPWYFYQNLTQKYLRTCRVKLADDLFEALVFLHRLVTYSDLPYNISTHKKGHILFHDDVTIITLNK